MQNNAFLNAFFKTYNSYVVGVFLFAHYVGMSYSKSVMSIASLALMGYALLYFFFEKKEIKKPLEPILKSDFMLDEIPKQVRNDIKIEPLTTCHPEFISGSLIYEKGRIPFGLVVLCSIYIFMALSGFWSENTSYFIERMRIKLPLLGIPLSFILLPKLSRKTFLGFLFFSVLFYFVTSAESVFLLFKNIHEGIQKIIEGGAVEVPSGDHVRYSLMLSVATFYALYLYRKSTTYLKYISAFLGLGLVLFMHILSIRSGIVSFYLGVFFLGFYVAIKEKKYLLSAFLFVLPVVLVSIGYFLFPSINYKIGYVIYEIKNIYNGNWLGSSDGERIQSIKAGIAVLKNNVFFGVGEGDLQKSVQDIYHAWNINMPVNKMPHNQWIWSWAASGIFVPILFLLFFFYIFFTEWNKNNWLSLVLLCICFSTFIYEHTLETQRGIAFFLIPLLSSLFVENSENEY